MDPFFQMNVTSLLLGVRHSDFARFQGKSKVFVSELFLRVRDATKTISQGSASRMTTHIVDTQPWCSWEVETAPTVFLDLKDCFVCEKHFASRSASSSLTRTSSVTSRNQLKSCFSVVLRYSRCTGCSRVVLSGISISDPSWMKAVLRAVNAFVLYSFYY